MAMLETAAKPAARPQNARQCELPDPKTGYRTFTLGKFHFRTRRILRHRHLARERAAPVAHA